MKVKAFILFATILTFGSVGFTGFNTENTSFNVPSPKMEGKIVKRDFISEYGGNVRETYDLFFDTGDTAYFIKMSESSITQSQAARLLNRPISIKGKIKEGRWDSDDPKIRSREGKYLVIQKIL